MPTIKIDTAVPVVKPDTIAPAELVNAPCPLCGKLVQATTAMGPELVAIQPCGCRI